MWSPWRIRWLRREPHYFDTIAVVIAIEKIALRLCTDCPDSLKSSRFWPGF